MKRFMVQNMGRFENMKRFTTHTLMGSENMKRFIIQNVVKYVVIYVEDNRILVVHIDGYQLFRKQCLKTIYSILFEVVSEFQIFIRKRMKIDLLRAYIIILC